MIFSKLTFNCPQKEIFLKEKMNGVCDKTISKYDFLSYNTVIKKEERKNVAEREYIYSYLKCAKITCEEMEREKKENPPFVLSVFYNYSLCIPCIYLCRHTLELTIKYGISLFGKEPRGIHGLQSLWDSFYSNISTERDDKEKAVLKSMGKFIKIIEELDDDGTKLRYASQKNKENKDEDKFSQERPMFVNTREIINTTEKFVDQIFQIDI